VKCVVRNQVRRDTPDPLSPESIESDNKTGPAQKSRGHEHPPLIEVGTIGAAELV
jgi:hypothetical protein